MGRRHWLAGVAVATACRLGFEPAPGHGDATDGSGAGDAGTVFLDAGVACTTGENQACASAGGTCDRGICTIRAKTTMAVTCPAMPCHVQCTGGSCSSNIFTCPPGGTCSFSCQGAGACSAAQFVCTNATCDLHCETQSDCNSDNVVCDSGTCTLHCCATNTCSSTMCNGGCSNSGTCP